MLATAPAPLITAKCDVRNVAGCELQWVAAENTPIKAISEAHKNLTGRHDWYGATQIGGRLELHANSRRHKRDRA